MRETDPGEERRELVRRYPYSMESEKSFKTLRTLLDRYLKGQDVDFDIDTDITDLPVFTQNVLNELRKIPYGETRSYLDIARSVGQPSAVRAVGQAVKKNPIPIIIPCHRVIRENGSLGGFSLGTQIKKRLLSLEGINKKWKP